MNGCSMKPLRASPNGSRGRGVWNYLACHCSEFGVVIVRMDLHTFLRAAARKANFCGLDGRLL